MTDNIDDFNAMAGAALDQLYRKFPVYYHLKIEDLYKAAGYTYTSTNVIDGVSHPRTVVKILDENGADVTAKMRSFSHSVLEWLSAEKFIRADSLDGHVLTSKALAAMNAQPASLDATLGTKLGEAVKDTGSTAGRAATSEFVGLIIGAAAKGFTQGA